MTCDDKDRHVLASAVTGDADVLVTANIRDFPEASVEPYGTVVMHPDEFLTELYHHRPREIHAIVEEIPRRNRKPPRSVQDLLIELRRVVPHFAQTVSNSIGDHSQYGEPAMTYIPDPQEALRDGLTEEQMFFPNGRDDFSLPETVAYRWLGAFHGIEPLRLAEDLSHSGIAFTRFVNDARDLDQYALAQRVHRAVDAPDDVAFMKLIPSGHRLVRTMNPGHMAGKILILVRVEDSTWRVWGLSDSYLPLSSMVHAPD